jgi:soluble lytic murein transglycosylase-like protein
MIEAAAREHALPVRFLTRLIWQESRFKVSAVSHAGARGIAQFMPATAAERDLRDPFDPKQALWAAAGLLGSLKQRFGNLGLAAAAYNAGPGRVTAWLDNKSLLPEETRNYVRAITGRPARSWIEPGDEAADGAALSMFGDDTADASCVSVVVAMASSG